MTGGLDVVNINTGAGSGRRFISMELKFFIEEIMKKAVNGITG